jgi:predicted phage terminase large subunit-like protein
MQSLSRSQAAQIQQAFSQTAARKLIERRRQEQKTERRFIDYLPQVSPPDWTFDAPHIRLIAEKLDAMKRGEIDRLAIFLPPRHSKSESVTVRFPLYLLEADPTERCLITGYNETIARRFNRKARNIAQTRGLVSNLKAGADEWETPQGGGIVARGVGTPPTGYGFGWIFIDDPIKKREEAESEVYREKVWDWYTDDLYTRLEPGGKIVLTLTRWHYDDVAARAIASEPGRWTVIRLPAIAEDNDPLNRPPGEALWPDRFPVESLLQIKRVQEDSGGAYAFEALYQQNPSPREGAFFKVAKLEIVDAAPANLRTVRAWDLAASTTGDYTAGVKLGVDSDGIYYILDVVRGRWLPDERNAQMKQTAALDGRSTKIRLAQDPGQAGVDQAMALTRMLAGYSVRSERVTGSKEARADAFASQVNAGNVKMLNSKGKPSDWNKALIEEMRQFPLGKNDDQADCLSDAFAELSDKTGEYTVRHFRI